MKYIRTKDGIIVDTTKYKNVVERTFKDKVVAIDLNHWGQDNDKYPTWIDVKDIIKQADTIEELCDMFILAWGTQKRLHQTFEEVIFWHGQLRKEIRHIGIVYGAIWTDKGLIYVAKMNKDGVLCLI